ncbi:MAG: polysaccharide deacetylase family protein [Acidimicrobiia bacterium]|jgi:peptidoglycan/xylan/chitin deacetylase (PgdA/CDA1 family)
MHVARALAKTVFAFGDLFTAPPHGPRVLIYHQVGTDYGHQMEVDEPTFAGHLAWLERERELVDLTTAVSRWGDAGSDRLVVITFDDGYSDVYTKAFPHLRERGVPFVLYLSTGLVGGEPGSGVSQGEPLSWDQVGDMVASGLVTVGAHTHSHPDMRGISASRALDELETSDAIIEDRVGVRPEHFAYPYGFWSRTADEVVRERYATAALGGTPRPPHRPDAHLLHRYPIQKSDGDFFFRARMRRGLRLEEAVRRRVKGYRGP